MASTVAKCPHCSYTCAFKHMHDAAHGIEGTHMAGSERFQCSHCNHNVFIYSRGAEGFKFTLDGKKKQNASG
jgi:DNA-directed RNA polymerase subunit RPC12/RpoP